jgi:hypothetical protein
MAERCLRNVERRTIGRKFPQVKLKHDIDECRQVDSSGSGGGGDLSVTRRRAVVKNIFMGGLTFVFWI